MPNIDYPTKLTQLTDWITWNSTAWPQQWFGFHTYSVVTAGNALQTNFDNGQYHAQYAYQNASANGNQFTQKVYMQAGNYTLYVDGITDTSRAKIDWYIDGVIQIAGQDWYSAANTKNVRKSGAVTVIGNGQHTLTGTVNGRNVAAGGWDMTLTIFEIR